MDLRNRRNPGRALSPGTIYLFPVLLADLGTRTILYALIITSIAGAAVTWFFRIETTGINLERIGDEQ